MAYIRYEYDPNDPNSEEEARAKAYGQFFCGFILLWGSLGCIIYFICSLVSLFNGSYSEDLLYSIGLLVIISIIDFFILFGSWSRADKKEMAKKYFLLFFGGALDLSGIIAIIVSIYSLCHYGYGATLLICGLLGVTLNTIVIVSLYRKFEGYGPIKIRLFTEKEPTNSSFGIENINNERRNLETTTSTVSGHIFCHKCGKCLPENSAFCSSCGMKLG